MQLDQITPLIITKDEMANISRTFSQLHWAKNIVVVDSFSADGTVEFLNQDSRVHLIQRTFDSFAQQCHSGLDAIHTSWVLSLDADYYLTDPLIEELRQLREDSFSAFNIRFLFSQNGKILRSSLYPPRYVLFRKGEAYFQDDGHGHVIVPKGKSELLQSFIIHDDRKSFERWWHAQKKYAQREVDKLNQIPWRKLSLPDRIRKLILPAPVAVLLYTGLVKGLILDGPPGWSYCIQRCMAECALSGLLIRKLLD